MTGSDREAAAACGQRVGSHWGRASDKAAGIAAHQVRCLAPRPHNAQQELARGLRSRQQVRRLAGDWLRRANHVRVRHRRDVAVDMHTKVTVRNASHGLSAEALEDNKPWYSGGEAESGLGPAGWGAAVRGRVGDEKTERGGETGSRETHILHTSPSATTVVSEESGDQWPTQLRPTAGEGLVREAQAALHM